MKILVLTDNDFFYQNLQKIVNLNQYINHSFVFMFSFNNDDFLEKKKRIFYP